MLVVRLIEEISIRAPSRPLVLAREITKLHEEFLRGTAAELAERVKGRSVKGECVLLFGPRRMEK